MGVSHVSWSSIELLHNVVRYFNELKTNTGNDFFPKITYRAKVKLHGTNCSVQITSEGVVAQRREGLLTPEADYKGFAKWVHARGRGASADDHLSYFQSLAPGNTIFGEWAGPGVEDGVALSELPDKVFVVFAIQEGYGEDARVIFDPERIADYLHGSAGWIPKNMHVLPWHGAEVTLDFRNRASLDGAAATLNGIVAAIEAEDPWVKATYGVTGIGEGVVLYPISVDGELPPTEPEAFSKLMFKAKGAMHKVTKTKEAVQVAPTVVASIHEFVEVMVTEARLNQGVGAACGGAREKRDTAKFLAWVIADVRKESVAELEASGLTWAQVEKAVQERARSWFLGK